jgi:hypothetical protein
LDELNQAQRYRGRANECRRLSKVGSSADIRSHYRRMTEYYTAFAEAEEAKGQSAVVISRLRSGALRAKVNEAANTNLVELLQSNHARQRL